MKTVWKYSKTTEGLRVLNCAYHIANNFFQSNNFYLLPYNSHKKNPTAVYFPYLNYNKIPRFWNKVKNIKANTLPIKVSSNLQTSVEKLLEEDNFPKPNYTNTQQVWSQAEGEVIKAINEVIPGSKKAFKKIIIYPTIFGTSSSFNAPSDFPSNFYMYLRDDQDIYTITEALLTSLTRNKLRRIYNANWNESELLVDWLITESKIGQVLKKYQPKTTWQSTIKKVRSKQNATLTKISDAFYKKLGIKVNQKVFSLNGKVPKIYDKPVKLLSKREREVLAKLIEIQGETVTYDEISEIIFTNERNYSLYAISKVMQRLRDKLEKNGVTGTFIQTQRGRGFVLKN